MLRPSKRFRFRLIAPAIVALLAIVGGLAANLIANALDLKLRPHLLWVWVILSISVFLTLAVLIIDGLRNSSETASITNIDVHGQEATVDIASSSLHQLPPPPSDFTGRNEEFWHLWSQLEHGKVIISALQGLAGVARQPLH